MGNTIRIQHTQPEVKTLYDFFVGEIACVQAPGGVTHVRVGDVFMRIVNGAVNLENGKCLDVEGAREVKGRLVRRGEKVIICPDTEV